MKNYRCEGSAGIASIVVGVAILTCAITAVARYNRDDEREDSDDRNDRAKTLYIWAGDQAHLAPDFLAVINFDEKSRNYGKVLKTVPIPPPGNVGNEPHHCHLSADKNTLACGGLLSLLRGQNSIFFFDVSKPRDPQFMFSTNASESSITDDFLPLDAGGFLVSQMGSASGDAPGRIVELDNGLQVYKEWPEDPPQDGFNPHGIDARPEINFMVTSDFLSPVSTLNAYPGDPILRGSIRRIVRIRGLMSATQSVGPGSNRANDSRTRPPCWRADPALRHPGT